MNKHNFSIRFHYVCILFLGVLSKTIHAWGYKGAEGVQNWAKTYPMCGSKVGQSPIHILTRNTTQRILPPIVYEGFGNTEDIEQRIENNGHSVEVKYQKGHNVHILLEGLVKFYVEQFHFHWGSESSQGSEHIIDNTAHPMELHVVTYNEKYDDVKSAVDKKDGLACLSFMFQIASKDNHALDGLITNLANLTKAKSGGPITPIPLDSILPSDRRKFYRYHGSLTTPTCEESVTWTVFQRSIPISEDQMNAFRGLESTEKDELGYTRPLVDNFRPVQPLGNRVVIVTRSPSAFSSGTHVDGITTVVFAMLCVILAV